jgi:hypothetical protein
MVPERQRERASDFSVSKLNQVIDARLGKWTVITCNFSREEIAQRMDVRLASRLGRGKNVIVDALPKRSCVTFPMRLVDATKHKSVLLSAATHALFERRMLKVNGCNQPMG